MENEQPLWNVIGDTLLEISSHSNPIQNECRQAVESIQIPTERIMFILS